LSRCRYGEGFDYNTVDADYWLVEIAGFETGVSQDLLLYTTMHHDYGASVRHAAGSAGVLT
jgi:hypothetical protein